MAEESETPGGGQGVGPEGRGRRSEGDLLAERRARRAAESGEVALMRRAEAAEATVQTLERHVASLQQRLREVEEERLRTDELLEAERVAALEREHELQRVKQREYAEQQLRIEAEDRAAHVAAEGARLDRESRAEMERLDTRLEASEDDARELARRLEGVQRQLAEAERGAAGAKRASASAEHGLQARLDELERRAQEIQRGLDAERAARERSERLLESMREGHRRMELLLTEMKGLVAQVTAALAVEERPQDMQLASVSEPERSQEERAQADRSTMAASQVCQRSKPTEAQDAASSPEGDMADALAAAVDRLRARAEMPEVAASVSAPAPPESPAPAPARPTNKHSMSLIGRLKMRRKQRRAR